MRGQSIRSFASDFVPPLIYFLSLAPSLFEPFRPSRRPLLEGEKGCDKSDKGRKVKRPFATGFAVEKVVAFCSTLYQFQSNLRLNYLIFTQSPHLSFGSFNSILLKSGASCLTYPSFIFNCSEYQMSCCFPFFTLPNLRDLIFRKDFCLLIAITIFFLAQIETWPIFSSLSSCQFDNFCCSFNRAVRMRILIIRKCHTNNQSLAFARK